MPTGEVVREPAVAGRYELLGPDHPAVGEVARSVAKPIHSTELEVLALFGLNDRFRDPGALVGRDQADMVDELAVGAKAGRIFLVAKSAFEKS